MMPVIMTVERMAEACQPVAAVKNLIAGTTSDPQSPRNTWIMRGRSIKIPTISAT